MKLKNLHEVILFGKVLSAGLVIAGYAFLGAWLCNWLNSNGWPLLLSLSAIPVITCFGIWQAWLFIKKWKNNDTINKLKT